MLDSLLRLLDHLAWADGRALAAISSAAEPPARAVRLLAHVLGAEHEWLARLEGRAGTVPVWPELTLDEAARVAAENVAGYRRFLTGLGPDDLARAVTYRNSAGTAFTTPVADILLHLFLHGSYHRGQVALLLRDAGTAPLPTDYVAYVRGLPAG